MAKVTYQNPSTTRNTLDIMQLVALHLVSVHGGSVARPLRYVCEDGGLTVMLFVQRGSGALFPLEDDVTLTVFKVDEIEQGLDEAIRVGGLKEAEILALEYVKRMFMELGFSEEIENEWYAVDVSHYELKRVKE